MDIDFLSGILVPVTKTIEQMNLKCFINWSMTTEFYKLETQRTVTHQKYNECDSSFADPL